MNENEHLEHLNRNCAFCKLVKEKNNRKRTKQEYRIVRYDEKEDYFVILSDRPKNIGHLLIVSKNPFNDITKLADLLKSKEREEVIQILEAVAIWSKKLKDRLGAKKVYVLSMCDHYELCELPKGEETTEHLHFHLIPRYDENKLERGEKLLTRPEQSELQREKFHYVLVQIRNLLRKET